MSRSTPAEVAMETDLVDVIDIDGEEEEGLKGAEPWTKEEMKELRMEMTKAGVVTCPKEVGVAYFSKLIIINNYI